MSSAGVGGSRSVTRPQTTTTQSTSSPPAQTPLQTLLSGSPQLKTNQDLINHLYKQGGGTWDGASAEAAKLGVDLKSLTGSRNAALPRDGVTGAQDTQGTGGATPTQDGFVAGNGWDDTSNVTGRVKPQFDSSSSNTTLPVDDKAKSQLDTALQQARQGITAPRAHREGRDNINTPQGAADATAKHVGPETGGAPELNRGGARSYSKTVGGGQTRTTTSSSTFNGHGNNSTETNVNADFGSRGKVTSQTKTTNSADADGGSSSVTTRDSNVSRNGRTSQSTSEDVSITDKDGRTLRAQDKVTESGDKLSASSSESDTVESRKSGREQVREAATDAVKNAKATIYHKEVKLAEGAFTEGAEKFNERAKVGRDPEDWTTGKYDGTGAGAKVQVLNYEASAGAGAYAQGGKLYAGADVSAAANLVSVQGRAQAGTSSSVVGAVSAQGEAKVGAEGTAGARLSVDLSKNPTVELSAGAKAFAGAKAEGSVAYQNRYAGVTAKGEASAGIGGEAAAGVSLKDGHLKAGVTLSGTLGLGLGGKIEVDVNVGAIAKDSWDGAKAGASWVGEKLGWW